MLRITRATVLLIASVSALAAKDVVINKNWPIRNNAGSPELSPPVVEQTNQCATQVFVWGFVPGATITVFIGGSTVIGGPVDSTWGFIVVPTTHPLNINDKITAIQEVNGVKSKPSAVMTVGAMPSTLPQPKVDPRMYQCGRVVDVSNLVSGVNVEVIDTTASNAVIGNGSTPNLWGNDWDPIVTSSLALSHKISARQSACTGVKNVKDAAPLPVLKDPTPFLAPTFETPIVGNTAVTLNGLYIGAIVQIFQGAAIGSGGANSTSNWFGTDKIQAVPPAAKVTAQQAFCSKGPMSTPVTPTDNIPTPTLVGPICPGSPGVIVRDSTINATLVLTKNGTSNVVGYGGAASGDVPLNLAPPNSFVQGDVIQVVEYIGSNVVLSNKIVVGCTNTITYHNDSQRTGWNASENTLTPSNVKTSFGYITHHNLDDEVDTQPLVVSNLVFMGESHTAVYVATEGNTVWALDSWDLSVLNSRKLGTPVPKPLGCDNNGNNVGINGTPTIDLASKTMYVIAYVLESGTPTYYLHALDLVTLNDKAGSPVMVKASNGSFNFNASVQRQRAALLLTHGNVYAAFGSFCDFDRDQSRGWVLGWNASTLKPLAANTLMNQLTTSPATYFLSSVWMSGYGVAADSTGNLYVVTGNSDNTSNTYTGITPPGTPHNLQESAVKIKGDLSTVLDVFTPNNVAALDNGDTDYGSGGIMVLPDQTGKVPHLAVAAGKTGENFILNRDAMGGLKTPNVPKSVMVDPCWCGPAYFKGSDGIGRVVSSGGVTTRTWKVDSSATTALSLEGSAPSFPAGPHDGGFFTGVSSNGTAANTQVIWAIARNANNDKKVKLYAFNGTASGSALNQLFSGYAGTWTLGNSNPYIVPTVANGRVYVATVKDIQVFGLISGPNAKPGRMMRLTEAPPPPDLEPVKITGAAYWGTINSVNGSQIVITLRTGRTLKVDLTPAMRTGTYVSPRVGLNVVCNGTLEKGVLEARTLTRAKGKSGWGPDRAK